MADDELLAEDDFARLAYLVSAIGVAGVLTLILMYAIEVPRGGPYVFGGINDVTGGLYSIAVIPLLLHLAREGAPTARWLGFTRAAVVSSALSSASSFLLVAKVLPFVPSTAISTLGIVVQAGWMLGFGLRARGSRRYPTGVLRLARLVGIGTFVGLPIAGLAFALPRESVARIATLSLGIGIGGGAWAAIPALWFLVGRALTRHAT